MHSFLHWAGRTAFHRAGCTIFIFPLFSILPKTESCASSPIISSLSGSTVAEHHWRQKMLKDERRKSSGSRARSGKRWLDKQEGEKETQTKIVIERVNKVRFWDLEWKLNRIRILRCGTPRKIQRPQAKDVRIRKQGYRRFRWQQRDFLT